MPSLGGDTLLETCLAETAAAGFRGTELGGKFPRESAELGPINLGNPDEFTMLELAELVIEQTGSSSRIVHMPLPIDDPRQRRPDIGKARTLLDWEPKVRFAELVQLMVDADLATESRRAGLAR